MKINLYAVQDRKAASFGRPFTIQNDAMALRAFNSAKLDESSDLGKYPEDFVLYALGSFDDETGVITAALPTPVTEV